MGVEAALAGVLGLLIGSFLNVVIHRLPQMMERQWAAECAALGGGHEPPAAEPFNLNRPRSRCPHCSHPVAWQHNIPLLSYLWLHGRCAHCQAPIGLRYFLVEAATGVLFAWCAWRFGASPSALAWAGYSAALLALALIDWDTTLLPDAITLPLLWAGLVGSALGWTDTPLPSAVWGAVVGYGSLWAVYHAFKLATGKEGMGYGDFKLFAALGAWFGWQALVPMLLMASVIGAVVGLALQSMGRLREGKYIPFGPFLAGAGLTCLLVGPRTLLSLIGF